VSLDRERLAKLLGMIGSSFDAEGCRRLEGRMNSFTRRR